MTKRPTVKSVRKGNLRGGRYGNCGTDVAEISIAGERVGELLQPVTVLLLQWLEHTVQWLLQLLAARQTIHRVVTLLGGLLSDTCWMNGGVI